MKSVSRTEGFAPCRILSLPSVCGMCFNFVWRAAGAAISHCIQAARSDRLALVLHARMRVWRLCVPVSLRSGENSLTGVGAVVKAYRRRPWALWRWRPVTKNRLVRSLCTPFLRRAQGTRARPSLDVQKWSHKAGSLAVQMHVAPCRLASAAQRRAETRWVCRSGLIA